MEIFCWVQNSWAFVTKKFKHHIWLKQKKKALDLKNHPTLERQNSKTMNDQVLLIDEKVVLTN